MTSPSASTASLAVDSRSLDRLRTDAARDPQGAVRRAAGQFESMFTQMVLKSMRDAMPKSGMWDGAADSTWQSMLDTQLAQGVSGRPGGLGEMIARQLSRNLRGVTPQTGEAAGTVGATGKVAAAGTAATSGAAAGATDPDASAPGAAAALSGAARGRMDPQVRAALALAAARGSIPLGDARGSGIPLAPGGIVAMPPRAGIGAGAGARTDAVATAGILQPGAGAASGRAAPDREDFVRRLWQPAQAAERATGVPATFIVGQAALETGWGRSEMRLPDGRSAHNLFGVKAGSGWKGATVDAATTEYVDGRPVRVVEKFRAYGSYEEAFRDWAALVGNSPRYAGVIRAGGTVEGFAQGLQRAGYATDPQYADKLTRTINQALRIRRLVV